MEINGKKVVNATKKLKIHITPRDASEGASKNPSSCAAARAVKRDAPDCVSARVHIGRVYVETPTKWIRYKTPDSLRSEIIAFDRGGAFDPGDYLLGIPETREPKTSGGGINKSNNPKTKGPRKMLIAKIKRHEVTGIRPKGASR